MLLAKLLFACCLPAGCPSHGVRLPCKERWSASELLRLSVCSALPVWPLLLLCCCYAWHAGDALRAHGSEGGGARRWLAAPLGGAWPGGMPAVQAVPRLLLCCCCAGRCWCKCLVVWGLLRGGGKGGWCAAAHGMRGCRGPRRPCLAGEMGAGRVGMMVVACQVV